MSTMFADKTRLRLLDGDGFPNRLTANETVDCQDIPHFCEAGLNFQPHTASVPQVFCPKHGQSFREGEQNMELATIPLGR